MPNLNLISFKFVVKYLLSIIFICCSFLRLCVQLVYLLFIYFFFNVFVILGFWNYPVSCVHFIFSNQFADFHFVISSNIKSFLSVPFRNHLFFSSSDSCNVYNFYFTHDFFSLLGRRPFSYLSGLTDIFNINLLECTLTHVFYVSESIYY